MWSATRPQSVGRYGWRPSPTEPGRVVDIVDPGGTQSQLLTIDATGHVVEGGEWWQGPVYAWERTPSTWTTTPPTKSGLYAWRTLANPSPRIVEVVTQKLGGVGCWNPYCERQNAQQWLTPAEIGGEWFSFDPPWESQSQSVNAELLAAAKNAREPLLRLASNEYACADDIEAATLMEAAIMRAEQQPADMRDATIERLRAALTALYQSLLQIDNGRCAICREGWRNHELGGAGPCSNQDCLSHVVLAALGDNR